MNKVRRGMKFMSRYDGKIRTAATKAKHLPDWTCTEDSLVWAFADEAYHVPVADSTLDAVRTPADEVNAPAHYLGSGGMQAIDVIEAFGLNFRLANAIKYVLRCDRKGKPLSDLRKAVFYLQREIAKREEAGEK